MILTFLLQRCSSQINVNGKKIRPTPKSATASDKRRIPAAVALRLGLTMIREITAPFPRTLTTESNQPRIFSNKFMFFYANSGNFLQWPVFVSRLDGPIVFTAQCSARIMTVTSLFLHCSQAFKNFKKIDNWKSVIWLHSYLLDETTIKPVLPMRCFFNRNLHMDCFALLRTFLIGLRWHGQMGSSCFMQFSVVKPHDLHPCLKKKYCLFGTLN